MSQTKQSPPSQETWWSKYKIPHILYLVLLVGFFVSIWFGVKKQIDDKKEKSPDSQISKQIIMLGGAEFAMLALKYIMVFGLKMMIEVILAKKSIPTHA